MRDPNLFSVELEQQEGKFKQNPGPVRAMASGRLERCLEQFEDCCMVTQSIRAGIPVSVSVVDAEGKVANADA